MPARSVRGPVRAARVAATDGRRAAYEPAQSVVMGADFAPGGQRLAIYQLTRPGVEASFEGRREF